MRWDGRVSLVDLEEVGWLGAELHLRIGTICIGYHVVIQMLRTRALTFDIVPVLRGHSCLIVDVDWSFDFGR